MNRHRYLSRLRNTAGTTIPRSRGTPPRGGFSQRDQVVAEQRYPLLVSVCEHCGLVQIVDPVDPEILFQDYSFATGTVAGLVKHFDAYAEWISQTCAPVSVVEFGCNDGTLLATLEQRGCPGLGRRPIRQHHRDGRANRGVTS